MRAVRLLNRVRQTVGRYRMFTRGQAVGAAVSGGADSVCLLHVLLDLAAEWDLRIKVVHIDHGLRGIESQGDAEFVADLARRLGLPFQLQKVDLSQCRNLEQAARNARMAFFRELIDSREVDGVALGHTRSDQAETVLFRFLRGSGSAGLAAIRPVTADGIVRPLLEVERGLVEQFLRERAISWREDSSNHSRQFARNRIRHDLLPQLASQWNPKIRETLAHTADWAQAEEAYWAAEIDRLSAGRLAQRDGAIVVRVEDLTGLPLAAGRRLVRRAIEMAKSDTRAVDFHHIAAVLAMAGSRQGSGCVEVPGLRVIRSFEWLRFGRAGADTAGAGYQIPAAVPGIVPIPGTELAIRLELIEKSGTFEESDCVYNNGVGYLDWGSLSCPLELRSWRPGDQYQPMGSTGKEKIKTLFQRARIPIWERGRWPILVNGASIVWARQFGVSAGLTPDRSSRMVLRVREISV